MKDEICQLFGYLQELLGSCTEHDITTDIFVSPANPDAYRAALEGCQGIPSSPYSRTPGSPRMS